MACVAFWPSMRYSRPSAERWASRAKIALGTLVEIRLPARQSSPSHFELAFAEIDRIHARMSAHTGDSDLARIAREAHRRPVAVDPDTYAVLETALALSEETGGIFDVRIGSQLAAAGLLPEPEAASGTQPPGDILLRPGNRVSTTAPVAMDLGGIAKGYAVDRAVAALRGAGVSAGVVNAGGDLRVFGHRHWHALYIRHPREAGLAIHFGDGRAMALATSTGYYGSRIVDVRRDRVLRMRRSVSVAAESCMLADALTKVVALAPRRAPAILSRFRAQAWIVSARGGDFRVRTAGSVPSRHLRTALEAER